MFLFAYFYVAPKNRTSFKANLKRNKNLKLICQQQKEPSENIIRYFNLIFLDIKPIIRFFFRIIPVKEIEIIGILYDKIGLKLKP